MINAIEVKKNKKRISKKLVLFSMVIGLMVQLAFYYIFNINIKYVSIFAVILLWFANSVVAGCVLDEVM